MDVIVQAFEIELGKGIKAGDFFTHLVTSSGSPVNQRYLYVTREDGMWKGVLLTARNIRAFTKMIKNGGRITMSPQAIADGELAHFNYFIIYEKTGHGLFQYYHGSASINGFASVLSFRYHELKEKLITADCVKAGKDPKNPPSSLRSRYAGFLHYQIVLRKKSFSDLIKELKAIRKIKVQFKEQIPGKKLFRSLASRAHSVRHTLSFRDQYKGAIRDNVVALVNSGEVKNMSGCGIGQDNIEQRFKLINEPEALQKYDFNSIVSEASFDSSNVEGSLTESPILKRLMNIAEDDSWMKM